MDEIRTPIGDSVSGSGLNPLVPASKIGLIIKIAIGVVILAVVGAGVVLGTRIWDPVWSPFRPDPEEVIKEMMTKMAEVKTMHSEMRIDLTAKEDVAEVFKVSLSLTGDSDNSDPENLKSTGDLEVIFSSEGMEFSLAGEVKTIGQTPFIKLTTIPAFPFSQATSTELGIDLNKIKNQWIKYDQESYSRAMLGEMYTPEMEEQMQKQKEIQEEMLEELKDIFKGKKFYLIKKEFSDEKVQNVKTYHYLVSLNEEEAKKVILELLEILIGQIEEGFSPMGASAGLFMFDKEEISKGLDEFFEKVGEISGELWFGKKDELLYKVKVEKEIDASKFSEGAKGKVTIKFEMEFSDFDKPVKIEAPKEFIGFEELFSFSPFERAKLKAYDAEIKAELSQIRAIAELWYMDNGSYTAAGGFNNGSEFQKLIPPACSGQTKYTVRAVSDAYAAWAKLCTYEKHWCVDSTGYAGQAVMDIPATKCQ